MTASKFFTGQSTHRVDAKGRVSLPVEFRRVLDRLGSATVIILPALEHGQAHSGFSEIGYEKLVAQVDAMKLEREEMLALRFRMIAGAHHIPVDDAGRIVLSRELREQVGIDGDARFMGLGSTFQIWEPGRCDAYASAHSPRVDELVRLLSFGGLHG